MTFKYNAVAFDMDGTLLDSMRYWRLVDVQFLAERGLEPPEEVRADMEYVSSHTRARLYAKDDGLGMSYEQIVAEYRRLMGINYQTVILPKPGAKEFLDVLKAGNVRMCLATACPGDLASAALERHGMLDYMEFVLSSDDVGMKKDDPAYYARVCKQLGLPPERCVMFEDALYAMRGAKEAGMHIYGIADPMQVADEAEIRRLCEVYIESYAQLLSP